VQDKLSKNPSEKALEKPFLEHLQDLKIILIRILIFFLCVFSVNFYFVEKIFEIIVKIGNISDFKIIFTSIESGFLSEISISFHSSLILLIPYLSLEIILFSKEIFSKKHFTQLLIIFSFGIFLYAASIFATLKFIIPLFVKFLMSFNFFGVDFYINATTYITFISKTIIVFGFIFETPIFLILLIKAGVIKLKMLEKNRKFVFVVCFVLSAVLTPPDVLSQVIAGVLLYLFFEIGIFFSRILEKNNLKQTD
jgi:sec-independent protein translocase protein TatC